MFINRDWSRTEQDDYVLNIESKLNSTNEAVPQYSEDGTLMGWKIQTRFE